MKRLAVVLFLLAVWACPGTLHASLWHNASRKAARHPVVGHPHTRHYTQKAQPHKVVNQQQHVKHYTQKANVHKSARHAHPKRKKVGRR